MTALAEIIPIPPEVPLTRADFLKGAIIEAVSELNDEKTLNYIYTMTMKVILAEMPIADF